MEGDVMSTDLLSRAVIESIVSSIEKPLAVGGSPGENFGNIIEK